jgi:hypothetical protein
MRGNKIPIRHGSVNRTARKAANAMARDIFLKSAAEIMRWHHHR